MVSRRGFLRSLSLATALPAVPALAQWDYEKTKAFTIDFPRDGDPAFWKKIRKMFLVPANKAFFNTGTLGAQPAVVYDTVVQHMRKVAADIAEWDYKGDDWISGYGPLPVIRGKLAALMNASTEEISLIENATTGMDIVANGLDLNPGDEILGTDQEHPGGRHGWDVKAKRCGAVYRQVPMPRPPRDPEEIVISFLNAFTGRTKVLAVPHIVSSFGTVLPVKELCAAARGRGMFTIIDGAQALGHVAVDVKDIGCDAYYSSMHKWLCAPAGNGVLYIRGERAKDIWTTLASSQWDNHQDEGYRLQQRGTGNLSLLMGLNAAIDFHNRIGHERVMRRIKELGDYLRAGLQKIPRVQINTPLHPAMCAGITNYQVDGLTGTTMQDALWIKGIRIRGNRQSTHIYNSEVELDATLTTIRQLAGA
ncbi:MAG: aminotransferase class V-fold PLP-dependent enzyme [Acidobacteriia bacterium]|nr:aminotransferase class V-fold PLP-dependent enzyme [Terriglobia bacterium]